jgi:isopenicillin-N epimerase
MNELKSQFLLRPDIAFLNFGSFGACPRSVFETYQAFQLELEQEPVHFIVSKGLAYLAEARKALGAFIHCHPDDVVYVTNPSYAVNTIARSLDLKPGDEVLTTDLEYGACDKTWNYYCRKSGARYVRQPITLPLESKEKFVTELFAGMTSRTRLIFISHITSSTALRFPVEEVCALGREKGIPVFIDGAHAPGQIDVDLENLGADMYTGACHKWMMTPKGSSFMYVGKAWQDRIDPLVISWGYDALFPSQSRFLDYHQMNGSRDYSAFLTIPASIDFMKAHDWRQVAASCRQLVKANAETLSNILGSEPLAPLTDDFILQMYATRIHTEEPEILHDLLFDKYGVQIPVMRHGDHRYIRYSINGYNDQHDLDRLFTALEEIKKETNLIR